MAFLCFGIALARAQISTLQRDEDPLVLNGAQLGRLLHIPPDDLVAFRFVGNAWEQLPVQVDERALVDLGQVYHSKPVGLAVLCYTDANTFTGPDPDPTLDDDDEVVLMLSDAGGKAQSAMLPAGVLTNSAIQLQVVDSARPDQSGYFYLFRRSARLDPSAGRKYISYQFHLLSGDYKSTYKLWNGGNPEDSRASSFFYTWHFADRWISDELRILDAGNGANLLDRHKTMINPYNCSRSESTFSLGAGVFIANKSGPVRGIRSYLGANSGRYTQRNHFFYRRRHDIITDHRVHPIGSTVDFFDYSTNALGMTNYSNLNPAGLPIDGVPDKAFAGTLRWELVSGPPGSLVILHRTQTDMPKLVSSYFYQDSLSPTNRQCTGDPYAIGSSGPWFLQVLCTDPLWPACTHAYQFQFTRIIYFLGANTSPAVATGLNEQYGTPPVVKVTAWPPDQ